MWKIETHSTMQNMCKFYTSTVHNAKFKFRFIDSKTSKNKRLRNYAVDVLDIPEATVRMKEQFFP